MRVVRDLLLTLVISGLIPSVALCTDNAVQEIKVGALLPLTGSLNSIGLSSQAAVELAVEDINAWLERNQEPYTFVVETADTATNRETALQGVRSLHEKNIQFIVGPFASSCVDSVKSFVDENDMLVLSPGSSSVSLSVPGDRIYRMVADDSNQGDAVSFYWNKENLSYIIPIYMDDTFGNSLFASTKKWVEERGGYYDDGIKIDPNSSEYGQDVDVLKQKVSSALATVSSVSVAIHVIAYDQTVDIMRLALQDANLSSVRWFGNDGFTGNNGILNDPAVCEFARSVGFLSPTYQLDFDFLAYVERLMFRLSERLQSAPDATALQTYDSVWLSFLAMRHSVETANEDRASALEAILPIYRGYTQVVRFNENGDRFTGMYVFKDIQKKGDRYAWAKNSAFTFITNQDSLESGVELVLNRLLIQIAPDYPEDGSWVIPVLSPLTGGLSSVGRASQKTYAIVREDLQNFLDLHGSDAEISVPVFDTETSSAGALAQLQSIQENQVSSIVVGPYSSGVLMGVKPFLDESGLISISPGSTSISLSIPNDNIYRMTMDDAQQAFALAAYMANEGVRTVIPVWLDDEYGNGLQASFKSEFESLEGIVLSGVKYSADESDFTYIVDELNGQLNAARENHADGEIGIFLISYDEGVQILALANGDEDLSAVRWFGSDSTANSTSILDNPDALDFALAARYTASSFAPELDLSAWKTARGRLVKSYFENYLTRYLAAYGENPGALNYSEYDSVWLAAMTRFKLPPNPPLPLIKQLMTITMKLTLGYCELNRVNDNGDKGYGTFGFATVVEDGDDASWQYNSAYHFAYEYDRDDWLEYYESSDGPDTNVGLWELF